VAHRVSSGSLHIVLPSVFAVGHPGLSWRGMLAAALLYAGDDCVLSHDSAAWVWGLVPRHGATVQLTMIRRHVRNTAEVHVHRAQSLHSPDVRLRDGLPVTAPARTLIDRAGQLDDGETAAELAQARVLKLVTDRDLNSALDLNPVRAGVARLRRVLASPGGPQMTRSEAERRMLALFAAAQLPVPEVNAHLHGFEVDFLWRAQRLVVEFDGRQFHGHEGAFERDRRRDQVLVAAGYRVIRVTWRQLFDEPVAVAVRIGQALAASVVTS
jgi:very-short-patch-repair endonuclease